MENYYKTRRLSVNSEKQIRTTDDQNTNQSPRRRGFCCSGCGCFSILLILLFLAYLIAPISTQFLLLGIDRAPQGTMVGRSDTIMIISVNPLIPTVKFLSIPRDLWVPISGYGENRINTAHFLAEAEETGKGPIAALNTVNSNFGTNLRYYVRFNLENFPSVIDSMGGISIHLPQTMAGFPAGKNQLNGEQALAFVRSRSDGDDFFRIQQGQLFVQGFIQQMLKPSTWPHLPEILLTLSNAMDTNIPFWNWPRLALALVRGSITGIESFTIDRNMVTPMVTSEGAQVLLPRWDVIHPLIHQFNK